KILFSEIINDEKTIYLTDYPPIELKTWSDLISSRINNNKTREIPVFILKFIASIGDIFSKLGWKSVPLTTFRYNNMITNMVYDTSELETICGQLPFNLEEGVNITVDWMENKKS